MAWPQQISWNADMAISAQAHAVLPASLAPRGLSRPQAAAYIGVSASLFDQLVKDGRMPPPKRINGRVVWDRHRLDERFDAIDDCGHNPWDAG